MTTRLSGLEDRLLLVALAYLLALVVPLGEDA